MDNVDFKQRLQEIKNLEDQIAQKKSEIRAEGVAQAQSLIDSLEIDVSELRFKSQMKPARKSAGGTVPVKYRGPNGETWTGRGREPRWLTALIEAGHPKEEFLIANAE